MRCFMVQNVVTSIILYSFFRQMYIDKINIKLIKSNKIEAKKGREKGRD